MFKEISQVREKLRHVQIFMSFYGGALAKSLFSTEKKGLKK